MPLKRDTTFDLVGVFCLLMAGIQLLLGHNWPAAEGFGAFGLVALAAGFFFAERGEKKNGDEDGEPKQEN